METLETTRLGEINTATRSILPTGKLKITNGLLLQEAEVIVHRPCDVKSVIGDKEETRQLGHGVYILWFLVHLKPLADQEQCPVCRQALPPNRPPGW